MILELSDLIAIWTPMGGMLAVIYFHERRLAKIEAKVGINV
ncbi:MAG: hypothetical protein PHW63_09310 [Alphaproteobacteria bacterium]|nr:hypothetical protein [Alphaproteobacteria bacterium]